MAKKIRFPLIMDRDAEARNLEELRDNFSLRAVLEYYENGKLLTWLENLYLLDEAKQIKELDKEAPDFQRRLCGIFQVEYTRDMDPKVIEQRKKRLERLRAVTDEDQFYRMIDCVAFDQEELAELLDEAETTIDSIMATFFDTERGITIYLCREEGKDFTFIIPASFEEVTYIGIPTHSGQKPVVYISGGTLHDIENLGITVKSCDMVENISPEQKIADKTSRMLTGSNAFRNNSVLPEGGIVIATGINTHGQCNVASWKNIISIACGKDYTVGLKKDGTVVATTDNWGQCNVRSWKDIVSIACEGESRLTVGLKKDGTVVTTGGNSVGGEVELWKDIVSISCGCYSTVGLKKGGTVVVADSWYFGCCFWHDIVSVACGEHHMAGLKKDGTVVARGGNVDHQCDVESWRDIVSIACGPNCTVGLKKDGTVVATGYSLNLREVELWKDIVSIACGEDHMAGLKKDGTVVDTEHYECFWHDIVFIACGGYGLTVGIQKT